MITGIESSLGEATTPAQTALLRAHFIVEARWRHLKERREKLKNTKFHQPKGERIISSFDAIDYGDEDFDPAAPLGEGLFDDYLFGKQEIEDSGELKIR